MNWSNSDSLYNNIANNLNDVLGVVDYKHGSWYPECNGLKGTGTYTKVGNMVYIEGCVSNTTASSKAVSVISGLPYAQIGSISVANNDSPIVVTRDENTRLVTFMPTSNSSTVYVTLTMDAYRAIGIYGWYRIA